MYDLGLVDSFAHVFSSTISLNIFNLSLYLFCIIITPIFEALKGLILLFVVSLDS